VSDGDPGGQQSFGSAGPYSGVQVIEGYNLLAYLLGDVPIEPKGKQLAPRVDVSFGSGTVKLQPFAVVDPITGRFRGLPVGPRLKAFLDNPLGGPRFDLTMPFRSTDVALSDRSALMRAGAAGSDPWHTAADLDMNPSGGGTQTGFDVIAAADGVVERNIAGSSIVVIRHAPANGRPYLTLYQHLTPASKTTLAQGAAIRRGDPVGRVQDRDANGQPIYAHLHFAVAVGIAGGTVAGVNVPASWYLIDPFGVYDYRRNLGSATDYNYLPNNTLDRLLRGRVHAQVFRTDPPIGSIVLPEDCLGFNPASLTVQSSGTIYQVVDGTHAAFAAPSAAEADRIIQVARSYQADRSCFVGRPDPSFTYLLRAGAAPVGALAGEDCIAFDPGSLDLRPAPTGGYLMVSGTSSMFAFPNMLEAGNALHLIRKYGFTRSCFVGRPGPSLSYLRR
jgi:murein DD-endopeptidase MepM/ murein hydrolase activator NlpD